MNSSSCSKVDFRKTGAVSRMKSFQNWPGSSGTSGAGARRISRSSKPFSSRVPAKDSSTTKTTRCPRCRRTSPMPTQLLVGPKAPSGKKTTVFASMLAGQRIGGPRAARFHFWRDKADKPEVTDTTSTPATTSASRKPLPGLTPPSGNKDPRRRLGDVAVELGFVDRELMEQVMVKEREAHVPMGALLVESGLIDSAQLARMLAERNSLDYVDLNEFEVDQGAANLIDESEARRCKAVPIAFLEEGVLLVATADPANVLGADDIAMSTGNEVRRAIATSE